MDTLWVIIWSIVLFVACYSFLDSYGDAMVLPESDAISMTNYVDRLAAERGVPVEKENGFDYKFIDEGLLDSSGGQAGVLVPRPSEEALVEKAHDAETSIHYFVTNDTRQLKKFYWVAADNSFYCWNDTYDVAGPYVIRGYNATHIQCESSADLAFGGAVMSSLGAGIMALLGLLFVGAFCEWIGGI